MTKEQLEKRVEELKESLDKSAAQHNALLGRLSEAMHMLTIFGMCEKAGDACAQLEMMPVEETCIA